MGDQFTVASLESSEEEPTRSSPPPSTIAMKCFRIFFPNSTFTKLLLTSMIPAFNALIPLFYAGQIPDSSALAIASQFMFISIILEIIQEGIVNSLFNLVGRDYVDKRNDAYQALKICCSILFILGSILCVFVIIFSDELISVINTPESIIEATKKYLYISAFSYPFMLVSEALKSHLLITRHILIVVCSICQVVITLLLNIFLFGTSCASAHWGVEDLGSYKVIESSVYFITNFFFFFVIEKMSPFTFLFRVPLTANIRQKLTSLFQVSWGNLGDSFVRNFFYFAVTLQFVNYLGADDAAAWNLVNTIVWTFLLIPSYALANHVKIAIALHADMPRLKQKVKEISIEASKALCVWMIVVAIFSVVCWSWLAQLFSPNNTNVQAISQHILYTTGWVFIVFSVTNTMSGLFIGTGKTRYIFYQSFISNMVVYFVPWICYISGMLVPSYSYVLGLYAAGMVVSFVLTVRFCIKLWETLP